MRYVCALTIITLLFSSVTTAKADKLHYFGGDEVTISRDIGVIECRETISMLMQLSNSLKAQIGNDISSKCNHPVSFTLPEVKRETHFSLDSYIKSGKNEIDMKTVEILAYPKKLMLPVKTWSAKNNLIIEDNTGLLEDFLTEQNIEYITKQSDFSRDPYAKIIIDKKQINFTEQQSFLPKIRITDKEVTIDMPFLEGLDKNPLKQYELLNIFSNMVE